MVQRYFMAVSRNGTSGVLKKRHPPSPEVRRPTPAPPDPYDERGRPRGVARAARGIVRGESRAMQTRTLGRTGLVVSRLGLGLAALGRPGYINLGHADDLGRDYDVGAMERHAHAVLDEAYRLGVRYFDAARSYGDAERFLASWLASRGVAPGAVTVGSKWGYTYTAGWRIDADRHEVKD